MNKTLWYAQPATKWSSEALPIGNGRLGAMLFGGVSQERIQFNEQSLWSGTTTGTASMTQATTALVRTARLAIFS